MILHAKGIKLDGTNPTIHAYGGYGISMAPYFSPMRRLWLDYGGVYALAGIRGGGEYGVRTSPACSRAAERIRRLRRQCSIGRAQIHEPRPAGDHGRQQRRFDHGRRIDAAPRGDARRRERGGHLRHDAMGNQPNGEFNVTRFGSTKDPAQFKALYEYSPLLRVKDGVKYPAVLLTTGDNDGRVAPYESRKMAARLQAATASGYPVLLRTEAAAGHGIGTALSTQIEEETDVYTFLVDQLGITGPSKSP
jgi:prolyl oligopeptidase